MPAISRHGTPGARSRNLGDTRFAASPTISRFLTTTSWIIGYGPETPDIIGQRVEAVLLLIVGAVASVVISRGYNVPREVRRNNRRIEHADQDLTTWIEDEQKGQRRARIRSIIERQAAKEKGGPDYSLTRLQTAKDEVLHRYRDQRRGAERLVMEIEDEEQAPHRMWRWFKELPVPQLTAPTEKAETVAGWEKTAKRLDEEAELLRAAIEEMQRKQAEDAGEPPPTPLPE